jgi:hypothetical protein
MSTRQRLETSHWAALAPLVLPPRRRDLEQQQLEEEAILFDPATGNSYMLNETALDVWRHCDGRATSYQVAQRHSEACDIDFATVLDHVEQVVALFAENGLFEGTRRP